MVCSAYSSASSGRSTANRTICGCWFSCIYIAVLYCRCLCCRSSTYSMGRSVEMCRMSYLLSRYTKWTKRCMHSTRFCKNISDVWYVSIMSTYLHVSVLFILNEKHNRKWNFCPSVNEDKQKLSHGCVVSCNPVLCTQRHAIRGCGHLFKVFHYIWLVCACYAA